MTAGAIRDSKSEWNRLPAVRAHRCTPVGRAGLVYKHQHREERTHARPLLHRCERHRRIAFRYPQMRSSMGCGHGARIDQSGHQSGHQAGSSLLGPIRKSN